MLQSDKGLLRIKLSYYSGLYNQDELDFHVKNLEDHGFKVYEEDKNGIPMACLDSVTNQVSITLNSFVVQAIITGMIQSVSYDALKHSIIWLWNATRDKMINVKYLRGDNEQKELTFGMHLIIDGNTEIDFRLTGDVADEQKNKCIDEAFKLIKGYTGHENPKLPDFAEYDYKKGEWNLVDMNEKIGELASQQKTDGRENKG